jgi:GTPase
VFERPQTGERAILVRIGLGDPPSDADWDEFKALALSAGVDVVGRVAGSRQTPDPKFFIGSGKAEEVRHQADVLGADVVLVDHPLSPSQERNLEKLTNRRVLDRSGLILDIFAQRARSHEGKLQVELAQLKHLQTRLVRGWTHLERQKGGIGLRGPGETQLETDRRLLNTRVKTLNRRLEKLKLQRDTGRAARKEIPVPGVALVGYTNAGKSTLFNALTDAGAYAADQLFATLDPTVRRVQWSLCPEFVLADTVGFVRELPHELIAAFRSTLLEAREAQLHLHVINAADPERTERMAQVEEVLQDIDAARIDRIEVFNQIDRLGESARVERDDAGRIKRVHVSARTGEGLELLQQALRERLQKPIYRGPLTLEPSAGRARARLFSINAIRAEKIDSKGRFKLSIECLEQELRTICRDCGVPLPKGVTTPFAPMPQEGGGYEQA